MTELDLAGHAWAGVLLFARLGAAVMLMPGLGEADVPGSVRLALGLALLAVLHPVLAPTLPALPALPAEVARLLLLELCFGLWMGLLARFVAYALVQAGQLVALSIGLASPLQMDPALGAAGTATGRLFGLLGAAIVLATDLHAVPLRALVASYRLLPPGAELPGSATAEALAAAAGDMLALAIQLAGPFLLLGLLGNLGMALLARLAPQMQVFVVVAPAQLLAGLMLLALLLPALLATWHQHAADAFARLPGGH